MRGNRFMQAAALACALVAPSLAAVPVEPGLAVWKEYELDFTYHGFTTSYSCEGLKYKLRVILKALGARPDPRVHTSACEINGGVARSPRARIRAAFPVPISGGATEAGTFPASFRTVTLSPREPRELEEGDCELVEQVRDFVLPKIGARILDAKVQCVPHQRPLGRPLLVVEVLHAEEASLD